MGYNVCTIGRHREPGEKLKSLSIGDFFTLGLSVPLLSEMRTRGEVLMVTSQPCASDFHYRVVSLASGAIFPLAWCTPIQRIEVPVTLTPVEKGDPHV